MLLGEKGAYLIATHMRLVKYSGRNQRRMPTQNKSPPSGRNPPIFFDNGNQLSKSRIRRKGGPIGLPEQLVILWGMYRGWSKKEAAHFG